MTLKHLINVAVAPLNPLSLILAGLSGMNGLRKRSLSLPLSPSLALVSSKACCTCCGWVMSTWRRVRRCEQVLCSSLAPSPFRSNTVANTSKPRESRCFAVAFPKPESQPAGTKGAFFSSSCLFTVNIKLQSHPTKKKKSGLITTTEKKPQVQGMNQKISGKRWEKNSTFFVRFALFNGLETVYEMHLSLPLKKKKKAYTGFGLCDFDS